MAFVKLDCGILDSTLWVDRGAREVFLTALLMATPREVIEPLRTLAVRTMDPEPFEVPAGWYGFVEAAGPGIVNRAGLPLEDGMAALERLAAPDLQSRSPEFEGRRLVRVSGGFVVLNFMKYRDRDHSAAERSRRYRNRKKQGDQPDPPAPEAPPAPVEAPPGRIDFDRIRAGERVTPRRDATTDTRDAVAPEPSPVTEPPNVTQAEADAEAEEPQLQQRSTADALARFPAEYRGDVETALGASPQPYALARELIAMVEGMHGRPVAPDTLGRAVRDLLLSGGPITGLRLRAFAGGTERASRRRGSAPAPSPAGTAIDPLPEVS